MRFAFRPPARLLFVILLLASMCFSSVRAQAQTNIFDARVFNWRFYLQSYGDLLIGGNFTETAARTHWQNHGLPEGRQAHPLFHTKQYLARYADVRAAYGATNYSGAITHYVLHGYGEGRGGYIEGGGTYYANGRAFSPYDRWTVKNSIISVSGSARQSGAVDSVMWNNREFINSWDHGRQLQMALSVHPYGEGYNPTEAGSCDDNIRSTSSSILEAVNASGSSYLTQSLPAFWRKPGSECGNAVNTTVVSGYRMNKAVQVGYAGLPNAIRFDAQIYIPDQINDGLVIEFATGYMTEEYSKFYWYTPSTQVLEAIPDNLPTVGKPDSDASHERGKPVIISTPDGSAAMGCWSPGLTEPNWPNHGYGFYSFLDLANPIEKTTKWSMVSRTWPSAAGITINRHGYVAVGSLATVQSTIRQLYVKHQNGEI